MRTIFSSLLCASLLIHAAPGCCWHDVHDAGACSGSQTTLATDVDCCHDHDASPDGQESQVPCKGHPNCHGLCHYLPVQKTSFGKCILQAPIDNSDDLCKALATLGHPERRRG